MNVPPHNSYHQCSSTFRLPFSASTDRASNRAQECDPTCMFDSARAAKTRKNDDRRKEPRKKRLHRLSTRSRRPCIQANAPSKLQTSTATCIHTAPRTRIRVVPHTMSSHAIPYGGRHAASPKAFLAGHTPGRSRQGPLHQQQHTFPISWHTTRGIASSS